MCDAAEALTPNQPYYDEAMIGMLADAAETERDAELLMALTKGLVTLIITRYEDADAIGLGAISNIRSALGLIDSGPAH